MKIRVQCLASSPPIMSFDSDNLDGFKPVCFVGNEDCQHAIEELDSSLVLDGDDNDPNALWVAVCRRNNDNPSVVARDDFFAAMNEATTETSERSHKGIDINDDANVSDCSSENLSAVPTVSKFLLDTMSSMVEIPSSKPVAVASCLNLKARTKMTKKLHVGQFAVLFKERKSR